MKIAVLTTGTNNVPPIINPLSKLGHKVTFITYDEMTHDEHASIPTLVEKANPDVVVHVGAIVGHHGKPVVGTEILALIGAVRTMVHLCFDGAEYHWWRQLQDYYDNGRFALQVNIDGVRSGPIGDRGLTTLCPVDMELFHNPPWPERPIAAGFSGGLHHGRPDVVLPLAARGALSYRVRDSVGPYDDYVRFLEACRVGLNVSDTGGGISGTHVKFRAGGELPAAGCLVLEPTASPLGHWFEAGQDYLEYASVDDAERQIGWANGNRDQAEAMAKRMRAKVALDHSPAVFWSQVFARVGLGEALRPLRQVPYRNWVPYWNAHTAPSMHHAAPGEVPMQLDDRGPCNIVGYAGQFYLVPKALGPMDLTSPTDRSKPGVEVYGTMADALGGSSRHIGQTAEAMRKIVPHPAPPTASRPITQPPLPRLRTGSMRRGAIG